VLEMLDDVFRKGTMPTQTGLGFHLQQPSVCQEGTSKEEAMFADVAVQAFSSTSTDPTPTGWPEHELARLHSHSCSPLLPRHSGHEPCHWTLKVPLADLL